MQPQSVAIVHDYFYTFGGAEKTVEAWLQLYPNATIYTNFITLPNFVGTVFEKLYNSGQLKVTAEQKLLEDRNPKLFKYLFWLHPIMARFGITIATSHDLLLVSSVYSAKYARFPAQVPIIHYCHSPTRFLYQDKMRTELDHKALPWYIKLYTKPLIWLIRKWDQKVVKCLSSQRTTWLTNSSYNQKILQKVYGKSSTVVFPPVDIDRFMQKDGSIPPSSKKKYLVYGRVVPIKKIERAISACANLQLPLVIMGERSNQEYTDFLKKLIIQLRAEHLIEWIDNIPDTQKLAYFAVTKAMIFPALEDFGIAPIEIIGSGIPVLALQGAGAQEYMQDTINGLLFNEGNDEEETIYNLMKVIEKNEKLTWSTKLVKNSVQKFDSLHTNQLCTLISSLPANSVSSEQ